MTITLPESIQIPQQSPLSSLLAGLGTGIAKGAETTMQARLKALQGLTPYQALQTKLREKEQFRKMESGVTQTLLKLAEEDVIQEQNIIPVAKNVSSLIRKGMNPAQALEQGVSDFQFQNSALDELDIGKYKASKAKTLKEGIINSLRTENITNPTLINRALKTKKWPTKERKEILKSLKGIKKEAIKTLTPELATKFLKAAKGDKAKARELAKKAGYSF